MCVCVRARMCVFAHVHLHECQSVQGEMLQLPCPTAHETHVMRIQLIFVETWHATSHTWAFFFLMSKYMSPVFAKLEQQNFQSFRLKRGDISINYAKMLWNVKGTHRYCVLS